MKEHVIYLDSGDDIHSTLDKLSWVKSARVLLVWPDNGGPLATRYELTRIVRYARKRGLQLGVVSFHPDVCASAGDLGIPVLSSLEQHSTLWEVPGAGEQGSSMQDEIPARSDRISIPEHLHQPDPSQSSAWRSLPAVRTVCILLAAVAISALAAVMVPSAVVYISPESNMEQIELDLVYHPEASALSAAALEDDSILEIVAEINTVRYTFSDYFLSSGYARIPDSSAAGEAVFTNDGLETVPVPAGTIVRSREGIRYRTLEAAEVKPGVISEPVQIQALEPGEEGNAEARVLQQIEGQTGLMLRVDNPEPLTGGGSGQARAVSSKDLRTAEEVLMQRASMEADSAALAALDEGEEIVPGSVVLLDVLVNESTAAAGDVSEGFEFEMEAEISYAAVTRAALQTAAENLVFHEMENTVLVPDSLEARLLDLSEAQMDTEEWEQEVSGESDVPGGMENRPVELPVQFSIQFRTVPEVPFDELRNQAAGMLVSNGRSYLMEMYNLNMKPAVQIVPSWLPFFPFLPERIQVMWIWEVSEWQ